LKRLIASDERLAWMWDFYSIQSEEWVKELCVKFTNLKPGQRELLASLDSITELIMTEVERHAALKAFQPYMDQIAGRQISGSVALSSGWEEADWQRLSEAFLTELNKYLSKSKSEPELKNLEMIHTDAIEEISARVRDTMGTVNSKLWPYLSRREREIDLEGLIRLMFSTSILYTRPLTREELCDFNIVNRDCS
jgi:hypothetical protein